MPSVHKSETGGVSDDSSFRPRSGFFGRRRTSQLNQATSAFFPQHELRQRKRWENDDKNAAAAADDDGDDDHHSTEAQSWGKGIVSDFRGTVGKNFWIEMTNLNSKTIAVSFFLFIAVIAPSITFGTSLVVL